MGPFVLRATLLKLRSCSPQNLPDPFANRGQQGGPGGRQGGPLSGPAQFITNAINSGSLRFDRGQDDEDMDADDQVSDFCSAKLVRT